jgi:ribosomal protein S18 acetylase RimI-like enzyme
LDGIVISLLEKNDIPEAAKVLSVAMLDNPLHVALFQGKDENVRREIENMFHKLLVELPGIVYLAKEGPTLSGVMRMKSCDGRKFPDEPEEAPDENDLNWRKTVWLKEWAHHDPSEQHWHLGPIGVLPSHRGMGIGSKLMQRFCREVDACRAESYLETDLDRNVRFYEKFGFKIVSRSDIFHVKNYYMVRPSKG